MWWGQSLFPATATATAVLEAAAVFPTPVLTVVLGGAVVTPTHLALGYPTGNTPTSL